MSLLKGLVNALQPDVIMLQEMGHPDLIDSYTDFFEVNFGTTSRSLEYGGKALAHQSAENIRCTTGLMVKKCLASKFLRCPRLDYDPSLGVSYRPPVAALLQDLNILLVTIHAIADRRCSPEQILNLIDKIEKTHKGPWILGGDMNQNPNDLARKLADMGISKPAYRDITVSAPVGLTQSSGGTLDFFIHKGLPIGTKVRKYNTTFIGSDHIAVYLDFN